MELNNTKKKHLRLLAHSLKPVVTIANKGVTEGVSKELERALNDHELIKVKISINDVTARKIIATQLCEQHKAALVQLIGKIAIICREAKNPSSKLSNLKNLT